MSASAVVPFSPDILWSPLYGAPVDAVPQARSSMRGTPRHVTTPSNLMEKLCAANRVSESTSKSNEVLSAQTATPCKVPCTPTRPKVNAPMVSKETPARANEGVVPDELILFAEPVDIVPSRNNVVETLEFDLFG